MKIRIGSVAGVVIASAAVLSSCDKHEDLLLHATRKEVNTIETEPKTKCEQELVFVDPGMCGGMWFKDAKSGYLEVYGWKENRADLTLREGDVVSVSYEPFLFEGIQCFGMTEFESKFLEDGVEYEIVMLTCQSESEDNNGGGHCGNSKFVFEHEDLCSGKWFKDAVGSVYEVYGLPESKFKLVVGEAYYFETEPFSKGTIIDCEAISEYEAELYEKGVEINVVKYSEE